MPAHRPNPCISEIEPGLYLGNKDSSREISILTENKISAMVSLTSTKRTAWRKRENRELVPEKRHMYIPCGDTMTQDILSRMGEICDFIDKNRQGRKANNVLVHCVAGVSRSATVVVAYLMRKYRLSLGEALDSVKECRYIRPNANFIDQLTVWAEVGYEVWKDPDEKVPKLSYALYLARRAERLKAMGQ